MILLTSFYCVHDLVPKQLLEGWNAEVSKGRFVRHSRGRHEPSEKPEHFEGEEDMGDGVDEEAEEDGEGADASSLLSCPVEGYDAHVPVRSTTTWSVICSSGSASSFQRSIPF